MPPPKTPTVPARPALAERPLIELGPAADLARTFQVLANDSRLRILHALARADELSVTELADTIGMKAQAVSNQLARLIDQHILAARRNGNRVYYRIADPCVTSLLELGLCLTNENC